MTARPSEKAIVMRRQGKGLVPTDAAGDETAGVKRRAVVRRRHPKLLPSDDPGIVVVDISTTACPNAILRVDADDWDFVRQFSWIPSRHKNTIYAVHYDKRGLYGKATYLHRQIMRARISEDVNHRDRDGLNCTKKNLRFCTVSQNGYNRLRIKSNSGFLGVHRRVEQSGSIRFLAYITIAKKRRFLGSFHTDVEAATARDSAARELHGEFARLNFPEVAP